MPVLLRVRELQGTAAPKAGRLLRVLLVRISAVSADSGTETVLWLVRCAYALPVTPSELQWQQSVSGQARQIQPYPFLARRQARRYRPRVALASTLAAAVW